MKTGGPWLSKPKRPKRKVEEANTLTSPPSIHTLADSITTLNPFDTLHLSQEEHEYLNKATVGKSMGSITTVPYEALKDVAKEVALSGKSTMAFRPKEKTCVIPEELLRELLDHVKALEKEVEAIKHPVYTVGVSDAKPLPFLSDEVIDKLFGKGKV